MHLPIVVEVVEGRGVSWRKHHIITDALKQVIIKLGFIAHQKWLNQQLIPHFERPVYPNRFSYDVLHQSNLPQLPIFCQLLHPQIERLNVSLSVCITLVWDDAVEILEQELKVIPVGAGLEAELENQFD